MIIIRNPCCREPSRPVLRQILMTPSVPGGHVAAAQLRGCRAPRHRRSRWRAAAVGAGGCAVATGIFVAVVGTGYATASARPVPTAVSRPATGSPSPSATGSPSPTVTPSPTASPSPTVTPSPTGSPLPTISTSPMGPPSPSPTVSPSPSRPSHSGSPRPRHQGRPSLGTQGGVLGTIAPIRPGPPLAVGTVLAQSPQRPPGNVGRLFPEVTPSPAVSSPGPAQHGTHTSNASLATGPGPAGRPGGAGLSWPWPPPPPSP